MKPISRRGVLKAAAGLVAFLPVAKELIAAPPAEAQCGCGEPGPPPPHLGPPPPGYNRCDSVECLYWRVVCIESPPGSRRGIQVQQFVCYDWFGGGFCYYTYVPTGLDCIIP